MSSCEAVNLSGGGLTPPPHKSRDERVDVNEWQFYDSEGNVVHVREGGEYFHVRPNKKDLRCKLHRFIILGDQVLVDIRFKISNNKFLKMVKPETLVPIPVDEEEKEAHTE